MQSSGLAVLAGVAMWLGVVLAYASAKALSPWLKDDDGDLIGILMPKQTYYEIHRNMILPAIAGTALVALIVNYDTRTLEWWATIFFVVYYSAEFALLLKPRALPLGAFILDLLSVAMFAYVMYETGALKGKFQSAPRAIFLGILAIPLLGALSRIIAGDQPRIFPSIAGAVGAIIGLVGACANGPRWLSGATLGALGLVLARYVICIVAIDGDPNAHKNCVWCSDGKP